VVLQLRKSGAESCHGQLAFIRAQLSGAFQERSSTNPRWWRRSKTSPSVQPVREEGNETSLERETVTERQQAILNPYKTNECELEAVQGIIKELRSYQKGLIEEISRASKTTTDFSQISDVSDVLAQFSLKKRDFFRVFFYTQIFTVFTGKLIRIVYSKETKQYKTMLERLDGMILKEEEQKASALSVLRIYEGADSKMEDKEKLKEELEETIKYAEHRIAALNLSKQRLKQQQGAREHSLNEFQHS